MKSYEDTKKEIIEFLNDPRFIKMFTGRTEFLKIKFMDMFDDIELMMKAGDDETIENKIEVKDLGACLDALM